MAGSVPIIPGSCSRFQAAKVFGLKDAADLEHYLFRTCVTAWEAAGQSLDFDVEGYGFGEDWDSCVKACRCLLDAGAVPDASSGFIVATYHQDDNDGIMCPLQFLESKGVVDQIGGTMESAEWKLTVEGLSKLCGHVRLGQPKAVLQYDENLSLHLQTTYGLWDFLCQHNCSPEAIMGGRGLKERILALPSFEVGMDQRFLLHSHVSK